MPTGILVQIVPTATSSNPQGNRYLPPVPQYSFTSTIVPGTHPFLQTVLKVPDSMDLEKCWVKFRTMKNSHENKLDAVQSRYIQLYCTCRDLPGYVPFSPAYNLYGIQLYRYRYRYRGYLLIILGTHLYHRGFTTIV